MSKEFVGVLSLLILTACTNAVDTVPSGDALFANYCSACHGIVGEGDGPVASVIQVNVPNLRTLAERSGGSFPADQVAAYVDGRNLPVAHGDRQMPIWGNVFRWDEQDSDRAERNAKERIDSIVDFLSEIQYE